MGEKSMKPDNVIEAEQELADARKMRTDAENDLKEAERWLKRCTLTEAHAVIRLHDVLQDEFFIK